MSRILGIDPGSRVTGYGIVDSIGSRNEYVTSGCIRTPSRSELAERLDEIFGGICQIIEEFQPDEMAIEQIFVARSAESALKLGHARGAAIVATVQKGVPVYEYAARKIKQAVVGTGAASKHQVQHMVKVLLELPGNPQADAADALATALCHINTQHSLAHLAGVDTYRRGRLSWKTKT